MTLVAPFPFFGGKRSVAESVWQRLGTPKHYIEPFCGSAAMLLAAPKPASLEVACDANGFIANFWRAVKHQSQAVAEWADYPVSHIDQIARHRWLMEQRERIGAELQDAHWPGDAQVAGYWLWGQCSWIGSGWCDWQREAPISSGKVPHIGDAGHGIQAIGQVPQINDAGRGYQGLSRSVEGDDGYLTSSGRAASVWLRKLANRLDRVRVLHGEWHRCLNTCYGELGGGICAVFLDPPYRAYEKLYDVATPVADAVEQWARENARLRIALCGHTGDYDLPGWDAVQWQRDRSTMGSTATRDQECIWYSPACLPRVQNDLFATA